MGNPPARGVARPHRQPRPRPEAVLDRLGLAGVPCCIDDGHVWVHGLDEMSRYPVQHRLGFQIWNVDSPHFTGAHGRSLHGHTIDQTDLATVEAARAELALTARYEED